MSVPVGDVAEKIAGQLGSFADLLTAAMFLVGIGMGAMAAFKFKAYNEDPRTHSLGAALAPLMLSACLIASPAFFNTVSTTLAPPPVGSAAEEPELVAASTPDPVEAIDQPVASQVDSLENGQDSSAQWVTERSIK